MAAKKTADWIPLCHNGVGLEGVRVRVDLAPPITESGGDISTLTLKEGEPSPVGLYGGVHIEAQVSCSGKTGVEMEALTAVCGAALTVVDMCKGVDKGLRIEGVRVVLKDGGRSGSWRAEGWEGAGGGSFVEKGGSKTRF